MRVLHIVNWYPNVLNPHEAPFIARHIEAMKSHAHQEVWHVEVRASDRWRLIRNGPSADRTLVLCGPLRRWMVIEWLSTMLVLWAWFTRDRSRKHDVVNFYIAYPLCTHLGFLRIFIRRPLLMMEQWSAYHFGFHSTSKGLDRIRRIFRHRVPVICVSQSLAGDIRRFSGVNDLPCPVVPNVVLTEHFKPATRENARTEPVFFAMAGWRKPKRPDVMIEALALLRERARPARLRLAGDGPEMRSVHEAIERSGMHAHVDLLGRLDAPTAAAEMQQADLLMHCSDYETFSVVCAEALCCGTPVVASNVGGIPGFVDERNGLLVGANDGRSWADAMEAHWSRLLALDRATIASAARARFSPTAVGGRLHDLFERRMKGLPVDND